MTNFPWLGGSRMAGGPTPSLPRPTSRIPPNVAGPREPTAECDSKHNSSHAWMRLVRFSGEPHRSDNASCQRLNPPSPFALYSRNKRGILGRELSTLQSGSWSWGEPTARVGVRGASESPVCSEVLPERGRLTCRCRTCSSGLGSRDGMASNFIPGQCSIATSAGHARTAATGLLVGQQTIVLLDPWGWQDTLTQDPRSKTLTLAEMGRIKQRLEALLSTEDRPIPFLFLPRPYHWSV